VLDVRSRAEVEQFRGCRFGQLRRLVKVAVSEKSAVRADPRPVELKLEGAVETEP